MKEVEKFASNTGGGERKEDTRFWQPTADKAGNGLSVIRFLPPPKGEELPWVRLWNHGFQGPGGKWYIENSLTSLGQSDPVSEFNTELWNSGSEANKEIARKQKRRLQYIANILVVKDPSHPENDGKVFLYKFGKKIFDKIKDVMQPQFEDEEPVNPFDFWKGANFKLKIRNVEGYRNYDKSEFDSPTAIASNDSEIESIWNAQFSLSEFLDPSNFKTYEELKKKLDFVLKGNSANSTAESIAASMRAESAPEPKTASAKTIKAEAAVEEDAEDTISYFSRLASDDE